MVTNPKRTNFFDVPRLFYAQDFPYFVILQLEWKQKGIFSTGTTRKKKENNSKNDIRQFKVSAAQTYLRGL